MNKILNIFITILLITSNCFGSIEVGRSWEQKHTDYTQDPRAIATYLFDGDANDSSGNYDGTVYGAVLTTGKYGQGYNFDGIDDYIDCGDMDMLDTATKFTITCWVYHNSVIDDDMILSTYSDTNTYGVMLFRDDSGYTSGRNDIYKIEVKDTSGDYIETSNNTSIQNNWTFLAVTCILNTTNGLHIYIDDIEDAYSPADTLNTQTIDSGTRSTLLGKTLYTTDNRFYNGIIDEVGIFNDVLTQEEIQEIMEHGLKGNY